MTTLTAHAFIGTAYFPFVASFAAGAVCVGGGLGLTLMSSIAF